jgi:hypothetical protein
MAHNTGVEVDPAERLIWSWYSAWSGHPPPTRPTEDELLIASQVLAQYGEDAPTVIAILVRLVRRRWPTCKRWMGAAHYLPEAHQEYQRRAAQQRVVVAKRAEDRQQKQIEVNEQAIDAVRRKMWDALPADIQRQVRDWVVATTGIRNNETMISNRCLTALGDPGLTVILGGK